MKFGTVPTRDAIGAVLAHSIAVASRTIKKGRPLTADDVGALEAAGIDSVIAAVRGADDVGEDEAAKAIAARLVGTEPTARVAEAFTGRCNIFAREAGVLSFDARSIEAINTIDERLTVATLRPGERVEVGQMLATVKIIPFAVPRTVLARAETAAGAAALSVAPFRAHRAGLVLTRLPGTRATVIEKRRRVTEERLERAGSRLGEVVITGHREDEIAAALRALGAAGHAPLLVFGAAAIADRADVVPAGLVAAGGTIARLGMPVDPGNLAMLGQLGATPVIGIPSCAASPKLNGFDWLLERVLTGADVTSIEIARMGVGGLLGEITSRPQPRAGSGSTPAEARRALRITCIVLAAGRSTRMGANKLLELVSGEPIVRTVATAARASAADRVVVVTGHQADAVGRALAGLDIDIVHNEAFADGLASSLRAGLAALDPDVDGVLVALGDMPDVSAQHMDRLIAAFSPADGRDIVVPVRHGKRGNPVLWARAYLPEMAALSGDTGAKHLLGRHDEAIVEVDLESDAVLADIDTPEALAALRRRRQRD